ncbi:hypothetical protein [Hymenobacter sp. BT190]|uniref:hypothetical protein n=1 Tax=Hymenobacter sp. BT190 TaxID=2763505 RepID=UPI001650FCF1|nr:hypothetical protein [Hymenobacter sp. BT190]MBC6698077.1 hypothetical protein [Hymenobacter sp. BT190]
MHEVARHLGGYIYTPEPDQDRSLWYAGGEFSHAGEVVRFKAILSLHERGATFRAEVSGVYATGPKNERITLRADAPRIGFLSTRPAAQLANDLRRRFIPDYRQHAAQVREAADRATLYHEKAEGARVVMNSAGFRFGIETIESTAYRNGRRTTAHLYGDVADLKLHSVPVWLVPQIMELIDGLTPGLAVAA